MILVKYHTPKSYLGCVPYKSLVLTADSGPSCGHARQRVLELAID
jgi:hypothetical protein